MNESSASQSVYCHLLCVSIVSTTLNFSHRVPFSQRDPWSDMCIFYGPRPTLCDMLFHPHGVGSNQRHWWVHVCIRKLNKKINTLLSGNSLTHQQTWGECTHAKILTALEWQPRKGIISIMGLPQRQQQWQLVKLLGKLFTLKQLILGLLKLLWIPWSDAMPLLKHKEEGLAINTNFLHKANGAGSHFQDIYHSTV